MIHLTDRLQKVADLVPACRSMADIGTDHGYIPIYLLRKGIVRRAIASDIHKGPLERAGEHVASAGLSEAVSLRLGGGLAPLSRGEVDGITVCGMGGLMIRDILAADKEKARAMKWLILQPQNHVAELKQYVVSHGFTIEKECLSLDEGQLYEILRVIPAISRPVSLLEAEIGVTEAYREDPLFPLHIRKLIQKRDIILAHIAPDAEKERARVNREKAAAEKKILTSFL